MKTCGRQPLGELVVTGYYRHTSETATIKPVPPYSQSHVVFGFPVHISYIYTVLYFNERILLKNAVI